MKIPLALLALHTAAVPAVAPPSPELRETFKLDSHYTKTLVIEEFPVVASDRVPDASLLEAATVIRAMLKNRPDIQFLTDAGLNMIRKHIKVEPRRYYTHCDRIGMLVWQDQVSSGIGSPESRKNVSAPWTQLAPNPEDAKWPDEAHQLYMAELKQMIDGLYNHPSIVQWVPFNEAWGQNRTTEVGKWVTPYDTTRQINFASGGNFFPAGHIADHQYPHPGFPFDHGKNGRFDDFVKVVGEFGGHGFPVEGHLWNPRARNWGYGGLPKNKEEWIQRYKTSLFKLSELRGRRIAAGIYTQTTDVEGEINGLITYDRKVQKLPAKTLKSILIESGLLRKGVSAEP